MCRRIWNRRHDDAVQWVVGEVVLAGVFNPLVNPRCTRCKVRPVILLSRRDGRCLVMGLTTRSHYADGSPRTEVQCPENSGLRRGDQSFLWGVPTWISVLDILTHVGYADATLLAQVSQRCGGHNIGEGLETVASLRPCETVSS